MTAALFSFFQTIRNVMISMWANNKKHAHHCIFQHEASAVIVWLLRAVVTLGTHMELYIEPFLAVFQQQKELPDICWCQNQRIFE